MMRLEKNNTGEQSSFTIHTHIDIDINTKNPWFITFPLQLLHVGNRHLVDFSISLYFEIPDAY